MSCKVCPLGYYCPLLTTGSALSCPSGFYANETQSESCTECNRGMYLVVLVMFMITDEIL